VVTTAVRAVEQAANALSAVAVNPIPQRLAIHTRLTRRLLSTMSLQQQRYRHHATRCVGFLRASSLPSQIRSRQLQPRDLHRGALVLLDQSGSQADLWAAG
jgi:hypothetical protein